MLKDINNSDESLLFVYADAANPRLNYHLDEIEYGIDATEYLQNIYELIYPLNHRIKIVYFCWNERKKENDHRIEYVSFDFKNHWDEVSDVIKNYLSSV